MNQFQQRLNQPLLNRIIEHLPTDTPMYLVGGAIRDALLGRPNYDLDFVTAGDALQIARKIADELGAAYFPMDTQRKVARIILKGAEQPGRTGIQSTKIDFSTFQGKDLLHDLQGRDFTMNAMAVEIHELDNMIDPLGGATDLLSRKLRPCSQKSLLDDPVRILRAVRFSVDLELKMPTETIKLIKQATIKIPTVSAERLRDELFRILLQHHPSTSMRILDTLNVLEQFLPEISVLKGVEQSTPHVMDVWNHTLDILARLESILDVLASDFNPEKSSNLAFGLVALQLGRFREKISEHFNNALNPDRPHRGLVFLAGLYHDVGKVKTRKVDASGRIRFIEHEHIGSQQVEERGKAMRLSNLEIDRLVSIIKHHMRPSLLSHGGEMPSPRAIYRFFRDTGAAGVDVCLLSLADVLATYGPTLPQDRWANHVSAIRALLSAWWEDQAENIFRPTIINGDDLIKELGLSPGPLIGYLLESVREAQVVGDVQNREEAIDLVNKLMMNETKNGR